VDWKAKADLFEQLRREHEFGIGTIAGVAAKVGVHRRVVRRAIAGALPPPQSPSAMPTTRPVSCSAIAAWMERARKSAARRGMCMCS
jgi:hypothetical protein